MRRERCTILWTENTSSSSSSSSSLPVVGISIVSAARSDLERWRVERAVDAPMVRRLFASKPRDPRYHMLSLLSSKFSQRPRPNPHEPRAAMFLNRFTRTLAIMYATNALSTVLGISADEVKGKSFYECIQENCLADAIRCLESAKANDSIAYMRFCFRDPRPRQRRDELMSDGTSSEDDEEEDGGVYLDGHLDGYTDSEQADEPTPRHRNSANSANSATSSRGSTDLGHDSSEAIFGHAATAASSSSSIPTLPSRPDKRTSQQQQQQQQQPSSAQARPPTQRNATPPEDRRIEVEAVVSCTSDGLVVILRRAAPIQSSSGYGSPSPVYTNGLFASPWAASPVMPPAPFPGAQRPFTADYMPSFAASRPHLPTFDSSTAVRGPPVEEFMNSIREVAVFAWSLTGINGSLAKFGRGKPTGDSQPHNGMPIWDPYLKGPADDDTSAEGAYGSPPDISTHVDPRSGDRSETFGRCVGFDVGGRGGEDAAGLAPRTVYREGGHDAAWTAWDADGEQSSYYGYAPSGAGAGVGASVHNEPYLQQDGMHGVEHQPQTDYSPGFEHAPGSQLPTPGAFNGSPYPPWLPMEANGGSTFDPNQATGSVGQSRWS